MKLTTDLIMALEPCREWPRKRVEALLATYGGEVEHAVLLRDPRLSAEDREWLGRQLLEGDDARLRFYVCDCAERTIMREPDPQGLADAVAVARRYAQGQATDAELAAAQDIVRSVADAARAADVPVVSWYAIWIAECAVWSNVTFYAEAAVGYAVRAAAERAGWTDEAWDAEREWQVKRLITYLAEKEEQERVV